MPGCQGDANLIGSGGDDFCIRLSDLEFVGNNGNPPEAFPLQKCQGDCDNNGECAVSIFILGGIVDGVFDCYKSRRFLLVFGNSNRCFFFFHF